MNSLLKNAYFLLILSACALSYSQVVINEIHYNPPDNGLEDGGFREFIELFNTGRNAVDLSGYVFDNGIQYTFSAGTTIQPMSYLVIAKDTSTRYWRNLSFMLVGPYEGKLSDRGERLTLKDATGNTVDTFSYGDAAPWAQSADGYGSSLERIHPGLPSIDYHSWRASINPEGTPGRQNSVYGTPPFPLITSVTIEPEHPTSLDPVRIQMTLDAPSIVTSAELRFENPGQSNETNVIADNSVWKYWKGNFSPSNDLAWKSLAFNDSTWLSGISGFGYGDLDQVNTTLNDMQGQYSTFYIRKKFQLAAEDIHHTYSLQIYYDDGFVAYLNGQEVARANAPQNLNNTSTSSGSHEANAEETFALHTEALLQPGENVLAIVGLNTSLANSSDFVLSARLTSKQNDSNTRMMELVSETNTHVTFAAVIPPMPSQSMVRANIEVGLQDGTSAVLPHEAEPIPFISYFVYDGEIDSTLPILWILPPQSSALLPSGKEASGAASLAVGESVPQVFDGAILIPSASSREKLRFIKGHEYNGDRTINIIPEVPTGGTNAGISSPYREHLGFWFYREMGVPSPWAAFYRVIRLPNQNSGAHTQQLVVQQVNENFLELNNRNPDADLYKLVYSNPNWEKHTNKDEGTGSIEELLTAVSTRNVTARRAEMEARLDLDEFLAFSAASIFVSNWDGYWNNNWMYLDPDSQRWEIIPWDLDWIWGATPPPNTGAMYFRMPLSFPIDGVAVGNTRVSRNPGPVTSPMHQEPLFYEQYIERLGRDFHSKFTMDKMYTKIDADMQMLLDDLALIQQQTGRNINQRSSQIQESYDTLKLYIQRRRAYLEPLLPASVHNWDLYAN